MSPHDLGRGALIDGRYKIVAKLGTGGSGVVYEVEHARTGRRLALKMLLDPGDARRLEQEARATAKLRSAHVPRVVDLGTDRGNPYLVMTLLEGDTLRTLLAERKKLSLRTAANIVLQVTECLEEAHGLGLVHRDLKPDNIHLVPVGSASSSGPEKSGAELFHVTVLDFGVVKMIADNETSALTQIGSTVGTPFYMSLEQLRGAASIDGQSDVYSLSVLLYEALTGTVPFTAATLGDLVFAICSAPPVNLEVVRPDVPAGICKVVMSGLASKKEDRPASMRAIAEAFLPHADPAFSLWLRGGANAPAPIADEKNNDDLETLTTDAPLGPKLVPKPAPASAPKPGAPPPIAPPKPGAPRPTGVASPGGPMFGGAAAKLAQAANEKAAQPIGAPKAAVEPNLPKVHEIEADTTDDDVRTRVVPDNTPRPSAPSTAKVPDAPSPVAPTRDRDTPTEMFVKGVHGEDDAFPTMSLDVPPELSVGDATAVLPALPELSKGDASLSGASYAFVPPPTSSSPGTSGPQRPMTQPFPGAFPPTANPVPSTTLPSVQHLPALPPVESGLPRSEGGLKAQTFGELVAQVLDKFKTATPKQQIVIVAVAAAMVATFFALVLFAVLRH